MEVEAVVAIGMIEVEGMEEEAHHPTEVASEEEVDIEVVVVEAGTEEEEVGEEEVVVLEDMGGGMIEIIGSVIDMMIDGVVGGEISLGSWHILPHHSIWLHCDTTPSS